MYRFLVDQSRFSGTWYCYLYRFSIQNLTFLLWFCTCDCILFSRLFNFLCPLAKLVSSLFNSFMNRFLFFRFPKRKEYPVIEIRAGHWTVSRAFSTARMGEYPPLAKNLLIAPSWKNSPLVDFLHQILSPFPQRLILPSPLNNNFHVIIK